MRKPSEHIHVPAGNLLEQSLVQKKSVIEAVNMPTSNIVRFLQGKDMLVGVLMLLCLPTRLLACPCLSLLEGAVFQCISCKLQSGLSQLHSINV